MSQYLLPILGGALIGISAIMLLYLLGRIAGISGIFFESVTSLFLNKISQRKEQWRWFFIFGLPLGALLPVIVFNQPVPSPAPSNLVLTITAAFLVGFGTKLGSGCTSGHGVCGISRFSLRSLTATIIFISAGIVTVYFKNLLNF